MMFKMGRKFFNIIIIWFKFEKMSYFCYECVVDVGDKFWLVKYFGDFDQFFESVDCVVQVQEVDYVVVQRVGNGGVQVEGGQKGVDVVLGEEVVLYLVMVEVDFGLGE